ncbi:MAG: proline dehydrogenase [Anaerolineae bacterium]|jgi:proline dehydrogenase|nr:MAG: proline dehydrogenase [Anaerolineae bacterium]
MLRQILLYLSRAGWARNVAVNWRLAQRVARRFVAGETLEDAVRVVRELNGRGILATLDCLGESVKNVEDTQVVVNAYQTTLNRIHTEKLQSSVSLKLTHLGLDISEDLCIANLRHILGTAKQNGIQLTIDMEDSSYTDTTLRIYRTLRDEYEFDNVGTVIQAYLRRSEADMQQLAAEGAHVRLCKGAYLEPPEVAFAHKSEVDANFIKLTRQFLSANGTSYLAIATHDEKMISAAEEFIEQNQVPADRYEFQMLYGIRAERQADLAAKGFKMRVYVPFGEAWYPYFMRRLAERPANVWFFIRSIFQR